MSGSVNCCLNQTKEELMTKVDFVIRNRIVENGLPGNTSPQILLLSKNSVYCVGGESDLLADLTHIRTLLIPHFIYLNTVS